jgi:hypothetical protein
MGKPTEAEAKALERLKQVCAKKGPKSTSTLQSCALLSKQLELEAKQKQMEMEAIARAHLLGEKMKAFGIVSSRMNALQNEATLLLAALQRASTEYDLIISTRAAQPLLGEIFQLLVLAALPELKVIGRSMTTIRLDRQARADLKNWKAIQTAAAKTTADSWDAIADEVLKVPQKTIAKPGAGTQKFIDSLDNASKDLIEAVKNPIAANANIDGETQARLAAFTAKNAVLWPIIKGIARSLAAATVFEPMLQAFIYWYDGDDVVMIVNKIFRVIGYDVDLAVKPEAFDLFAEVVLYDMLRGYTTNYVKVDGFDGAELDDLPQRNNNVFGLDSAQRKMVYNKFGKVKWSDTTRPPVNDYKDLIRHWKATFNKDFRRFKLSLGGG